MRAAKGFDGATRVAYVRPINTTTHARLTHVKKKEKKKISGRSWCDVIYSARVAQLSKKFPTGFKVQLRFQSCLFKLLSDLT